MHNMFLSDALKNELQKINRAKGDVIHHCTATAMQMKMFPSQEMTLIGGCEYFTTLSTSHITSLLWVIWMRTWKPQDNFIGYCHQNKSRAYQYVLYACVKEINHGQTVIPAMLSATTVQKNSTWTVPEVQRGFMSAAESVILLTR